MAVKLHRCSTMWLKVGVHPCWKVQKALDDAGVDYTVVKHPSRRSKRAEYTERTGERLLPAIELEDGTVIREDSSDLVRRIESGNLQPGAAPAAGSG